MFCCIYKITIFRLSSTCADIEFFVNKFSRIVQLTFLHLPFTLHLKKKRKIGISRQTLFIHEENKFLMIRIQEIFSQFCHFSIFFSLSLSQASLRNIKSMKILLWKRMLFMHDDDRFNYTLPYHLAYHIIWINIKTALAMQKKKILPYPWRFKNCHLPNVNIV